MTSKQLLLALGELDDNTVSDAREPMRRGIRRPLRTALIAAAAAVLCLSVAWGVTTVINSQRARFVKTGDEFWQSDEVRNQLHPTYFDVNELPDWKAADYLKNAPMNAQHCADLAGQPTEWNAAFLKRETADDEGVEDGGTHWDLIMDGGGMPTFSAMGAYEESFHPDVSYLESTFTPIDGSFYYISETGSGRIWDAEENIKYYPEQLFQLMVGGGYLAPSGGFYGIAFDYLPAMGIGPTIYVGDGIARREVVKSADGTEFDVIQIRDIVIAEAVFPYGHVFIHGIQCTWDEVVDQIAHLDLNDVPTVFSTGK